MKIIKIVAYIVLLFVIISVLPGCKYMFGGEPIRHTFLQERSHIEKVEICTYSPDNYPIGTITPITELSQDEIDSLWAEIPELPAVTVLPTKGPSRIGDLLFVITYNDGLQELVGFEEQGYIYPDGSFGGYRSHTFVEEWELADIFAKYADPETLAEISDCFDHWYGFENE